MRATGILLVAFVGATLNTAYAALDFTAYLKAGDQVQVLIADVDTGKKSRWLTIGDSFEGHVLIAFDRERESITLNHAGRSTVLRIKDSQVLTSERESTKAELNVMISDKGVFILDGKEVNQLALIEYFERLSRTGKQIALTVLAPSRPTNQNAESTRKALNSFAVSGAKGSVSILRADGQAREIFHQPKN